MSSWNGKRLVLSAWLASGLFFASSAHALFEDDYRISGDRDHVSLDTDRRAFQEIQHFIDQGYPDEAIYLHGVSLGMSIADLVYLVVQADPENVDRHYQSAVDLLPSLPGWACREGRLIAEDRYAQTYSADQLPPTPTVQEIARRYFESNVRLSPLPDWSNNQAHVEVSTEELRELVSDGFWYSIGREDRPVNDGVMVSLYRDGGDGENRIMVDGNLNQVKQALEEGRKTMPVVVIYNEDYQRPLSSFGENPAMSDIVDAFFEDQTQVTLVPNWNDPYGDYHTLTPIDEFENYLELPAREEIDEERWEALMDDLKTNGFRHKPVLITLYYNASKAWADDPARIVAAKEAGIEQAPVTYLYQSIDRQPCGVLPGDECEERIRQAAGSAAPAAGGRESPAIDTTTPPPPSESDNPSPS